MDNKTEIAKIASEAYGDLVKPAAKSFGGVASLIPQAINAALFKPRKWIMEREYKLKEVEALLLKKVEGISANKITEPEPYIAIPALQAISYSMDNEALRDMFANLLARAINVDERDLVHPSFVEVIKQLSPFDAENVMLLKRRHSLPIARISLRTETVEEIAYDHIFVRDGGEDDHALEKNAASLVNLERLGLIQLRYGKGLIEPDEYERIRSHPPINELYRQRLAIPSNGNFYHPILHSGRTETTSFGKSFIFCCL